MELEENKDNIIEEPKETAEEPVTEAVSEEKAEALEKAVEETASDYVPENTSEEVEVAAKAVEEAEESAPSEENSEEEPAVEEEEPAPEEELAETENAPDENDATIETAPDEEAEAVVDGAAEEKDETAQEEKAEESPSEESAEPAESIEPAETEERVAEEEKPVQEEKPEEEPPLVTEIIEDEAPETEESAADEDAQDLEVEYETILEEPVSKFEETAAEEESKEITGAQESVTEAIESSAEEEQIKIPDPQPEGPLKTKKGSLAIKIVGIVLLLLLIFVPAGYSLIKGDAFQKELIDQKKSISRSYETIYRKEIFPKLSKLFIPKWAKQPEPEPEPQGSAQVEPEPQTPDTDKPKDILDGVPQVPEGLEYYPLYIEDHMIIYGRDNWLYTAGDGSSSLEYFAGTNVLTEDDMAYCADLLNTLGEICRSKGVELVMEVGPNKEQVYPEHFPSYTVENKYKRLLVLEEYLHEHSITPFVYPIRELAAHKDQYDTYWMYDTHWNSTGSYIGMKAIYEALGRPITDKDALLRTEDTNRGDLAGITGYTDLYKDYITEYKPEVTVETEVYCDWEYDIDDYGKRYISTAPNEKKLFVCGDSFRVSLAAHMCKDYKYTDVVHREIVGLEIPVERLRALTEGDTLVLVCVERWDYYMFSVIPIIIEAMQG